MAPTTAIPILIDECLCQYLAALQAAPVAVTATCPVPTGEITGAEGWADSDGNPVVQEFVQALTPSGTSFAGRTITESSASPATDSCWFPNSEYEHAIGITGGTWETGDDNRWGPDSVGWYDTGLILYYRQQRSDMGLPMLCGWTAFQRLEISDCVSGTTFSVYRPSVTLEGSMSEMVLLPLGS